ASNHGLTSSLRGAILGRFDRRQELRGDFIRRLRSVNRAERGPYAVVLHKRFRISPIDSQALPHDFLVVVRALNQAASAANATPGLGLRPHAGRGIWFCETRSPSRRREQ